MSTAMTSDRLGAHLEAHDAATVLLPGPDGADTVWATIDGLTVEAQYGPGGAFKQATVCGPGVNATYTDTGELLRQLDMTEQPAPAEATEEEIQRWLDSLPPEPDRDPSGRIIAPPARVGDVWGNYAIGLRGRTFRVTAIVDGYAYGLVLTDTDETRRQLTLNVRAARERRTMPYPGAVSNIGTATRIKLARMRPTADGYYRISAAQEEPCS